MQQLQHLNSSMGWKVLGCDSKSPHVETPDKTSSSARACHDPEVFSRGVQQRCSRAMDMSKSESVAFIRTSSTIGIASRLKEKAVWSAGSVAPRTSSCHIYVCWRARAIACLAKSCAHNDPAPCEVLSRQKVASACLACTCACGWSWVP